MTSVEKIKINNKKYSQNILTCRKTAFFRELLKK